MFNRLYDISDTFKRKKEFAILYNWQEKNLNTSVLPQLPRTKK